MLTTKKVFLCLLLIIHGIVCYGKIFITEQQLQKFDSIAREVDRLIFLQKNKARLLIQELYDFANQFPGETKLKGECFYHEAELVYIQGFYDSTFTHRILNELETASTRKDDYYKAILHYSLALNKLTNGSYADAFTYSLHAIEYFKQIHDTLFVAKSLLALGRACSYIESHQMAKKYYEEGLAYAKPTQREYYQLSSNLCTVWLQQSPEAAADSLRRILLQIEKSGDIGLLIFSYLNMGAICVTLKDYEIAYQYFEKVKNASQEIDNEVVLISLYQNMGDYYIHKEDYKKAHQNFLIARNLARYSKNPNLLAATLPSLAEVYEHFHKTDSAYSCLKEYNSIKAKALNNANLTEAYQAYISVFLEASNKEIIIKEQEILLKNRRYIVTVISAIGIILLITSFLIIFNQQKRHSRQQALLKEAENKDLEERLQSDKKIQELQKEKIAAQVRELTSYSLALSNKNNILQQIATAIDRDDRNATNEIRQVIKNNLNTDRVWKDFVVHFDKVHPDFFNRIKAIGTELSENDLRLCAYLRIGMTTKQIAQILNVSPESIRMHRYRIKKKLGLLEEQKLDDFIRNV